MRYFLDHIKKLVFCIVYFSLSTYSLIAQTLPIRSYSIQNGLPESRVYAIYLDRSGYLWTGTQSGVCSFDGLKFRIYDSLSGLPDNHVTSICGGNDKQIWFGHRSGKISCFQDGRIKVLKNAAFENTAGINQVLWQNQSLFIATDGDGVYVFTKINKDWEVQHFLTSSGLADNVVNKLCIKNKDEIWVATNKGLNILNARKREILSAVETFTGKVSAVAQRGDSLFCGTEKGLLVVEKGSIRRFPPLSNLKFNHIINAIFIGRDGELWLATNEGAIQVKGQNVKTFGRINGLLSDIIYDIGEDREHSIWLAQDDGISSFRRSPFELFNTKDGLIYNESYSIEQDAKENFWVGTRRGISIFRSNSQGIQPVRNLTRKDGLPDDFVYDLFCDSHNNMWIACAKKGAACYITSKNKIITFGHQTGLAGRQVVSINEDKKGRIWLATLDSGLAVYDYSTQKMRSLTKGKGFVSNGVWDIHRDKDGYLWFGTRDHGLIKHDPLTDAFSVIDIPGKTVNYDFASITSDKMGHIWIGTIGDGVLKYDGHRFEKYGFRNGLKSNNPYFVYCDREGQIWVGNNLGLDNFNPYTKSTINYLENDGFLGIETNQNAIYESGNGDLWIGTVKGLMHYKRQSERSRSVAPLVHISKKQVFFKDDSFQNTVLKHNQNYITFEYTGVSLNNAEKIIYKYKLAGLSDKWSPGISDARVSYANLSPGDYVFMVKAGFPNGNWSSPASYSFKIISPFYRTWWFIVLSATLLYLIGCWIYQYRVEQLLKFQTMRNKIASDLHDDMGSALTSISILSEVADQQLKREGIQDTREIIGHIANHSRTMLEAMEDIVWAVDPRNDQFNDLFIRMREYAIPLLEARNIDFNIDMDSGVEDVPLLMAHRRNIYLIFKEAINNILKHANCSKLEATVKKEGKKIIMTIADNGRGFDSSVRNKRNGLKNLKKRAAEMNAQLDVISTKGEGTLIKLLINIL
ncbi:two-component regulator propeller domain-containing protein [Mucilaginibacter lutimaris]|uniref:Two-component regulator propeller domain-containing protein n=1 Tax=Mucilaginibacter lutimaris TaxID=931629 RepID=A0ABW2ZKS6_9SPHI